MEWGITALAVFVIGTALALIMSNLNMVMEFMGKLFTIFSPVFFGLLIAFILNPLMTQTDRNLVSFLTKKTKLKPEKIKKLSRAVAIMFAIFVALFVIYMFFALLLPNLVSSLTIIVSNMQSYYDTMQNWISDLAKNNPQYNDLILTAYNSVFKAFEKWLEQLLENDLSKLASSLASQVVIVVKAATNLLIGLAAAIYLLASKEKFLAQVKKVIIALVKREKADRLFVVSSRSFAVFTGFINGKIVDSLIIGILCYIGMLIIGLPYPSLIATIIGVTNIIPFFGPIIGLVPCALLILLIKPIQALYFAIFILALQQLDGNVIGPHILGDRVGLPSFWILISITVFGSMFGFAGMLFGVPVFAVIYMLFKEFIEKKLTDKGAPISTNAYYDVSETLDLVKKAEQYPVPNDEEISEEELAAAEKEFWQ